MERITIRLDDELLQFVDSYIDYISVKNRSDAIRFLLQKSLSKDKIAVILNKGNDLPKQSLYRNISLENDEFVPIASLYDSCLLKEQIKRLVKSGFTIIYLVMIPEVITLIKSQKILSEFKQVVFHYIPLHYNECSADALRLLKDKINTEFLMLYSDILFDLNLSKFYDSFMDSNYLCSMAVTYSDEPKIKGSVAIEGDQIVNFLEKTKVDRKSIVAEPIFMIDPDLFDRKGSSLPYDVFPELVKEKILGGFMTSSPIVHLHTLEDKEKFSIFFS